MGGSPSSPGGAEHLASPRSGPPSWGSRHQGGCGAGVPWGGAGAGHGVGVVSSPIPPAQSRQDLQDVGAAPHRVTRHPLPGLVGKKGPGGRLWLDPSPAPGTWWRAGLGRGACQGWVPSPAGSGRVAQAGSPVQSPGEAQLAPDCVLAAGVCSGGSAPWGQVSGLCPQQMGSWCHLHVPLSRSPPEVAPFLAPSCPCLAEALACPGPWPPSSGLSSGSFPLQFPASPLATPRAS